MFINEYGNRNDPTVILLAPMMISGSDLYGQMSQFFQDAYHIIAPDQGGHGKAGAYINADEEYQTLKSFLLETCCTNIELVYGASMGFAEWLVSRMFRKRKKLSGKAISVYMPKAELTIRPGYQHCGYMAAHPKEYVEEIEQFIGRYE